eukprot:CAMPEP_0197418804 /NCGR_PEP_ID=MMETSP1170-20131217/4392_1 /TAXON_ID=54406 /ORGANISM="Sarcinochrysis sp, Strain CCMP770" /LENGTH=124 /DNA_ID=CAMNT_0042945871 /DNA_START=40 /DNA_END=413 /DNA_ORIENTATION=+
MSSSSSSSPGEGVGLLRGVKHLEIEAPASAVVRTQRRVERRLGMGLVAAYVVVLALWLVWGADDRRRDVTALPRRVCRPAALMSLRLGAGVRDRPTDLQYVALSEEAARFDDDESAGGESRAGG